MFLFLFIAPVSALESSSHSFHFKVFKLSLIKIISVKMLMFYDLTV